MGENLEAKFHQAMVNSYHAAKEHGYIATYFLQMISEHGGVGADKRLISTPKLQSGLTELYFIERLDLSAEALVLQELYRDLFTDCERRKSYIRLKEHGYDPCSR
jgi:hypothetical protein